MPETIIMENTTGKNAESPFIRGTKAMADWLNVSEVSVRRAVRNHTLPVVRFGGSLLFRRSDVETVLEKLTVPSAALAKSRK